MGILSNLYLHAPLWAQNTGVSLYGLYWKKRRYGGIFKQELELFKAREFYTSEEWSSYQEQCLKELLLHAFETVPFYRDKYESHGFHRKHFKSFKLSNLKDLPMLTKDELRRFGTTTLLSRRREPNGAFFASSGSTGTPTQILFSRKMHQRWSAAFEARIRNWAGVTRFDSRGMIGGRRVVPEGDGRPPYYRYNFIEKQVYFSAYHISPSTIENYVQGLKNHQVQYLTGYAQSNFFLARFLVEHAIKVDGIKAVITSSEKLTDPMRETFKKAYGCKAFDSYSGLEACGLISESENGQLLVNPDVGILEILDDQGNPVEFGQVGEVISTGLLNFDQPLIRYRIGDLVELAKEQATKCGREMTVIKGIAGRVEDVVIGKDGREMVRFHGIFVGLPNLQATQVIQESMGKFKIKFVSDHPLSEKEQVTIRQRMRSQLGEIDLELERVLSIPLSKNGKARAVISHVLRKAD